MKNGPTGTLFGIVLLAAGANAAASEVLRYNPFEEPDIARVDRSGAGSAATAAGMELRGTLVDGQDSMANIGGEYYRLNQDISGYRIVRIESGSVTLLRAGNETVLTLHDEEQQ